MMSAPAWVPAEVVKQREERWRRVSERRWWRIQRRLVLADIEQFVNRTMERWSKAQARTSCAEVRS